jgi:hypothetical protein
MLVKSAPGLHCTAAEYVIHRRSLHCITQKEKSKIDENWNAGCCYECYEI